MPESKASKEKDDLRAVVEEIITEKLTTLEDIDRATALITGVTMTVMFAILVGVILVIKES